jgi:hypothetical protein
MKFYILSTFCTCLALVSYGQVRNEVLVTIGANTEVHVFEEISNTGDFDIHPTATLHSRERFVQEGSSNQNLDGHVIVEDVLEVNNSSGMTVAPTGLVEVYTSLDMNSGHITANAPIVMKSLPAWTAYMDDFSAGYTGTYSGNLTMERHVATSGFHHMGGAVDVTNIASELSEASLYGPNMGQVIPQASCDPNAIDGASPYGNMFEWDENAAFLFSCYQSGWFVRSSGPMENGRGYSLTKAGNTNFELTGTPHLSLTSYGPLGNTNSIGSGFHLVSNPYPSDIEWNGVTGFDAAIYIWQSSGNYAGTYQSTFMFSGTRIASQQAFFARRSAGSGNFSIALSDRRTGSATYFREAANEGLEIVVKGQGFADRTLINFDNLASVAWDGELDALKMEHQNGQPLLASNNGTDNYSVNTLNINHVDEIPLVFRSGNNGEYELDFTTLRTGFMLEDKKLNYYGPLGESYKFQHNTDDREDRFVIHLKSIDQLDEEPSIGIYATDISMVVRGNLEGDGRLDLVDMTGRIVWSSSSFINKGTNDFAKPNVARGLYILRLNLNNQMFEERLLF